MDYVSSWLSSRYASVYMCFDWNSLTFRALLVVVFTLGLVGTLRRRDRPLTWLFSGLLLLLVGDLIFGLGLLLVGDPTHYHSFVEYVDAQRPWQTFGNVDRAVVKPVGSVLAFAGAVASARYRRTRRLTPRPGSTPEAEPPAA